jgi:hypothetical protein
MKALVAGLAMAAGVAGADELPKVGPHPAVPEVTVPFDRRITVDARITVERGGDLATEISRAVGLRFEAGFTAEPDARDADLRFHCKVVFVKADGSVSPVVRDRPCFAGPLSQARGQRVELDAPLLFRPGWDDPVGASGVMLILREEGSRRERRIMATYGWTDGG